MERWPRDTQTFIFLFNFWKYAKSKHMGLSFKSHFKHLRSKVAVWLSGIASVPYRRFWVDVRLKYDQIIVFKDFLMFARKMFAGKVLGSLFSIECFIWHFFHILILYLMFILKQNTQFIFKWTCISCMTYRVTHILYIMLFLDK